MESDLIIKFDDLILSDYFDLLGEPEMGLFAPVTNELVRSARGYGSQIKDSRSEANTITLPVFSTRGNWRDFKDDISILARDKELHRIWFSHEPDRYYLGKLDGESKLVRSLEQMNEATGSLTFIIPDGLAHGIEEQSFFSSGETLRIENNGTYKTPVRFQADFTEDTSYLGILTENQIIQLGTVDEPDVQTVAPSTVLWVDEMTPATKNKWSFKTARIRWKPESSINSGEVGFRSQDFWAEDFGNYKDIWHGPSITRYTNDSSVENWEATFRVGHKKSAKTPKVQQQGMTEMNIVDKDNNFIAGVEIKKGFSSNEYVDYYFFIGDTRVYKGSIPYERRDFFGNVVIKKVGNKFTFSITAINPSNWKSLWTYSRSYTNDDVSNLRANAQTVWWGLWSDKPPMELGCSYTKFVKINTSNIEEEALTFSAGDHLEVTEKLKVFLNGTPADDYLANGSDKIYIEPGNTDVLIASDKTPIVKATIRNAFL